MSRLPDLEAWAIFAKVADEGSFVGAAQALGLSQATVSKAVARLERRLKISLFHRNSRRLSLTDGGQRALVRAARLLAEGEALEAESIEQSLQLRGPVRMTAPMSFGISHLAPLLPAFMAQHPEVTLNIHFSDAQVDLVAEGFDLALRLSSLADSSLLARRICSVDIHLVGATAYFERHGRPRHPRDLANHRALLYAHARHGANWHFRHSRHGAFAQQVPVALQVNNAEAMIPALDAGLGLALQPAFLAWEQLQSGALEIALPDWQVEPIGMYLLTPPGRNRPARVQALMDHLAEGLVHAPWARVEGRHDGQKTTRGARGRAVS
ncbi:MAG: LysR family transcriptional regulator [Lautropia sp.]|nr:LysR family transcriptional regulator [Lautropia sp.]